VLDPANSNGNWALIWSPFAALCDTKISGAGTLLNVTLTPPRVVESGTLAAEAVVEAKFVPKIETSDPGATGCPFAKLAPFTTPPWATVCPYAAIAPEKHASMNEIVFTKAFPLRL
jgi:hypothetical protein